MEENKIPKIKFIITKDNEEISYDLQINDNNTDGLLYKIDCFTKLFDIESNKLN